MSTPRFSKLSINHLMASDDENIAIMHAFVDQLDFRDLPFVAALRVFLQAFRLPGEAQKIDRFMLKFAARYIAGNSKTPFANAGRLSSGLVLCVFLTNSLEAAYVLAYSIILLNTDAHNPQIKRRMTKAEFVKNNRGINDNSDLPEELLSEIFDDIINNEIRMKDEIESPIPSVPSAPGLANAIVNVGRDLQREAYVMQSSGMASKTEVGSSNWWIVGSDACLGSLSYLDAVSTQRGEGR